MTTYFPSTPTVVDSDRILYTASPFARSSLIHLQEIGTLTALRAHITKFQNLASYLFFVVQAGEGTVIYEGKTYNLSMGDCVFVDCQTTFSHETSVNNLWTLQWCHFYGPSMPLIYEKYLERGGVPVFRPREVGKFVLILDTVYNIAGSNDYLRDMKINEILSSLLTLLMAESWHKKTQRGKVKQSVLPVKDYLDEHYMETIMLDDLAERFYISKNYLTRIFREQFGMSIKTYLQVVRITQAKRLLRTTDKTIEEIGVECGFGSLYYFSRCFKEIEGTPPSIYRSQW